MTTKTIEERLENDSNHLLLHQLFEMQVEKTPENTAVLYEGESLSYRVLNEKANQLAYYLRDREVQADTLVAIMMDWSPEMLIAMFGVLKSGAAYLPIDTSFPIERVNYMLEDSQARILLTTKTSNLPADIDIPEIVDINGQYISTLPTGNLEAVNKSTDLAYLIYTSGSTGKPKGVMIEHEGIINTLSWRKDYYSFDSKDTVLQLLSFSFDGSVENLISPLLGGAKLLIPKQKNKTDLEYLGRLIRENKVTHSLIIPNLYKTFLEEIPKDLISFTFVTIAGESFSKELVEDHFRKLPDVKLHNEYGPTENSVCSSAYEFSPSQTVPLIGKPLPNVECLILDDTLQAVPVGEFGELYLGGKGLSRGYLNKPELTSKSFIPHPEDGSQKIYKTGDIVRFLPDGNMEISGRIDEQVKIRGYRIELGEIESTLKGHPEVSEAVVLIPKDGNQQELYSFFVSAKPISESSLRNYLSEKLPDYMIPVHFIRLDKLPVNPNGKIDKNALSISEPIARPNESYQPPRNETEEKITGIWSGVLGVNKVGINDNFFRLGGDSIKAAVLAFRMNKHWDTSIDVADIMANPTIVRISQFLEDHTAPHAMPIGPAEARESYPLSVSQERMWFLDQVDPMNPTFNITESYKLIGNLNASVLRKAITKLVQRHESLRTRFQTVDGGPVQIISPVAEDVLHVIDLSDMTEAEQESMVCFYRKKEIGRKFQLEQDNLLYLTLLHLGPEHHVIIFNFHHIIFDGWSLSLFYYDLAEIYGSLLDPGTNVNEINLESYPFHYKDYSVWQRKQLKDVSQDQQLAYWKQKLKAGLPSHQIPVDFPAHDEVSHTGDQIQAELSEETTKFLTDLSSRHDSTLFMTLLTAYKIVLSKRSGQEVVTLGSPIANRNHNGTEKIIGLFLNTLALRTDLSGDPDFEEALRRVRKTTTEAFQHQDIPFDQLLAELQPKRDLNKTPFFQTFFNMLLTPLHSEPELNGISSEKLPAPAVWSIFDLTLYVTQKDRKIQFNLVFKTELFKRQNMAELLAQYLIVLEQIGKNSQLKLSDLSLLTVEAKNILPDPGSALKKDEFAPLPDLFCEVSGRFPNQTAVIDFSGQWSYQELNARSNQLAHYLQDQQIQKREVVAIYADRSAALVWAILGIMKSGAVFVILDSNYPEERLAQLVKNSGAKGLIHLETAGELPELLTGFFESDENSFKISLPGIGDIKCQSFPENYSNSSPKTGITSNDPAYLGVTSGTTGDLKLILGTHLPLSHFISWHTDNFGLNEQDSFCMLSGLSHDPLLRDIFTPLCLGATLNIPEAKTLLDPGDLRDWLGKHRISVLHTTPAMCQLIAHDASPRTINQLSTIRYIFSGGDRLLPNQVINLRQLAPQAQLVNFYGTTETPQAMSYHVVPDSDHEDKPEGAQARQISGDQQSISIGRGVNGAQLLVLSKSGKQAGIGEIGEICVRSPYLSRGYINDKKLTQERFIQNPFLHDANDRIYKTGDLGIYSHHGNVYCLGRSDQQVKIRGYRVELGEIESILLKQDNIKQAVVSAIDDPVRGSYLEAYLVPATDGSLSIPIIREALRRSIPEALLPAGFKILATLPLNPNGKVDYKALHTAQQISPNSEKKPPTSNTYCSETSKSAIERKIKTIWLDVLGLNDVGQHEHFFDVGGHSLLVLQVHTRLNQTFSKKIQPKDLFRFTTISQLTGYYGVSESPGNLPILTADHQSTLNPNTAAPSNIAVIGVAGAFPGAEDVEQFWDNLCREKECITFFTDKELLDAGIEAEWLDNPNYIRAKSVLRDADCFDARFFGINPREAELMDPQQRVFLECAWKCLEDSGHAPGQFQGRIGVFAGATANTYLMNSLYTNPGFFRSLDSLQPKLRDGRDFLSTQVSYKLKLNGPGITLQTACSTSLVAIHTACQSLIRNECDMTLAGGVSISTPLNAGYFHVPESVYSPDGHCRPFDAQARGTVFGDGVGIVLLKRLQDALDDGDTIKAVIKGTAINNDGDRKIGYTAPSEDGQVDVIRSALLTAGIDPQTISYVEAHGTGTALGDPVELAALNRAFNAGESHSQYCAIGSVKSNIGHLNIASGVTGFIKTVMSLHHKKIPASLHFNEPNPQIEFENSPFYVNTELQKWERANGTPLRAGVSSFGIGGTNAHAVLEEAPDFQTTDPAKPEQLVLLSAKSETALQRMSCNLADFFNTHPEIDLADAAYTLKVGRAVFEYRQALVASDLNEAVTALNPIDPETVKSSITYSDHRPLVFMFPGQGGQYVNMGSYLYEKEEVFREAIDRCADLVHPLLIEDLRDILFPTNGMEGEQKNRLEQVVNAQPVVFTIEYATAKLLQSWGIQPEAMIGHSLGEYVAACLAGVFSLEDALAIVCKRGQLLQAAPGGAMLSIALTENRVTTYLDDSLSLAATNAPEFCTVSGPISAIESLESRLQAAEVSYRRLYISTSSHSHMVDLFLEDFVSFVESFDLQPPQIPFISNVTGTWIKKEEATDAHYWGRHFRQTVRFAAGLETILNEPDTILMEVGPGHALSTFARQQRAKTVINATPHAADRQNDRAFLLDAVAQLWLAGFQIDWNLFYANEKRRRIPLPTYSFDKKRYWIDKHSCTPDQERTPQSFNLSDISHVNCTSNNYARPTSGNLYTAPESETEIALSGIWRELLGIDKIGVHDHFLELGGHSLMATQFLSRVKQNFGVDITLKEMFAAPTIARLSNRIESRADSKLEHAEPVLKPIPNEFNPPLSFAQERLWMLDQLENTTNVFNLPFGLRFKGSLDIAALQKSLTAIIRRHEILRTSYTELDGKPKQEVLQPVNGELPVTDLRDLPPDEKQQRQEQILLKNVTAGFDLKSDLLIRMQLLRIDDDEYFLLLVVHHIAFDGWSIGVFIDELTELYKAFVANPAFKPDEKKIQYKDYAAWKKEWLTHESFDKQLDYWREELKGANTVLNLPIANPRPAVRTYNGDYVQFRLPVHLTEELNRISRENGCTLFMTLMAAFNVLLYRYSYQDDILVGTPIANRNHKEIEDLLGFFVNVLVFRTVFTEEATFADILQQLQKKSLDAYSNQDFPFEKLVDVLNVDRDLSISPLFQFMFVLQNFPKDVKGMPDLNMDFESVGSTKTEFDLTLYMNAEDDTWIGSMEYNTDLFSRAAILQLSEHFQALLDAIVSNPRQRVSQLTMLSEKEIEKITVQWNQTEKDYGTPQCLHHMVEAQVERTPDATAVVFEDTHLSYLELNKQSNKLARELINYGAGPDTIIGIYMERSLEMVIGLLAILKAGAAYLPLDPSNPKDRLSFMIEDANLQWIITQNHLTSSLPESAVKVIIADSLELSDSAGGSNNPDHATWKKPLTTDHLAYVIYTSGSTGRPKGVLTEHKAIYNRLMWMQETYGLTEADHVLQKTPFGFDVSVWEFFWPLITGARLVVAAPDGHKDNKYLVDLIKASNISCLHFVPSMLQLFLEQPEVETCDSLQKVICSGEALPFDLKERFFSCLDSELHNLYGPTEAAIDVTYWECRPVGQTKTVPIGYPIANVQTYVLDKYLNPVPPGVLGELHIGGFNLARGYLNRPELTKERFITGVFPEHREKRLYKTGDLVKYRDDGVIEYSGRLDFQVKIRGFRIELGEIENVLQQHADINECVLMAVADDVGDKQLIAYLVAPGENAPSEVDLRDYLKDQLPEYMIPSAFVFLDSMPLTVTGKTDRLSLPAPEIRKISETDEFVEPASDLEKKIAEIWTDLLKIEKVGVTHNFFDIGGDSFKAIRAVRRIGDSISVMDMFKYPTIRDLANYLDDSFQKSGRAAEKKQYLFELTKPIPKNKKRCTLVCVPYGGGSAVVYQPLARELEGDVSLYSVQLPGHDLAKQDEAFESIESIAKNCLAEIKEKVEGKILLYGHCVGGALTLEIARLLEQEGLPLEAVYIGGAFPVSRMTGKLFDLVYKLMPMKRHMNARSAHDFLQSVGGFDDSFNEAEKEFMIDGLRHDATEAINYYTDVYAKRKSLRLKAPISCIIGEGDRLTEFYEERYREWESFSEQVNLSTIPKAGHYFIKHQAQQFKEIIYKNLESPKHRAKPEQTKSKQNEVNTSPKTTKQSLGVFFLIALGQFVSMIGTELTSFAVGVWLFMQTGSVSQFAIISVCALFPGILVLPFAGAVADRYDRRKVLILSDIIGVSTTIFIGYMLWTDALQVWQLYISASVGAIANAFQRPAFLAATSQLVPKQYLGHANGVAQLAFNAGRLLSPLLGGFLVVLIGLKGIVIIDFFTFIFAVSILLFVRFPNRLFKKREEPILQEIAGGWRYITKRRSLKVMFVFFTVINFFHSLTHALIAPMVLLSNSVLTMGRVMTSFGVGVLIGGGIMSIWGGTKRRAEGMIGFYVLMGIGIMIIGIRPEAGTQTLGYFLFGVSLSLINAHWQALMQLKVGLELQGRVIAINQMFALSMMPLGYLVSGYLADNVFEPFMASGLLLAEKISWVIGSGSGRGIGLIILIAGFIVTVLGFVSYHYPVLRYMEDELPDAIPDAEVIVEKDQLQKLEDHKLLQQEEPKTLPN